MPTIVVVSAVADQIKQRFPALSFCLFLSSDVLWISYQTEDPSSAIDEIQLTAAIGFEVVRILKRANYSDQRIYVRPVSSLVSR